MWGNTLFFSGRYSRQSRLRPVAHLCCSKLTWRSRLLVSLSRRGSASSGKTRFEVGVRMKACVLMSVCVCVCDWLIWPQVGITLFCDILILSCESPLPYRNCQRTEQFNKSIECQQQLQVSSLFPLWFNSLKLQPESLGSQDDAQSAVLSKLKLNGRVSLKRESINGITDQNNPECASQLDDGHPNLTK